MSGATGAPEKAAAHILAGIAVLDGAHLPILIWTEGLTWEEKAAWHEAQAARYVQGIRERDELARQIVQSKQEAGTPCPPGEFERAIQFLGRKEWDQLLPELAPSQSAHLEEGKENSSLDPVPLQGVPAQEASDAC